MYFGMFDMYLRVFAAKSLVHGIHKKFIISLSGIVFRASGFSVLRFLR